MKRLLAAAAATLALGAVPALAQNKSVKIGFVSTFSGPTAVIGDDMRNSLELALDHMGRKMGGLPVEVIYEDDQQKPEIGRQKAEKLVQSDKVDFVSGFIWSNVLLASVKPIVESKTFLVVSNAGLSPLAGKMCSPYVFSTSWTNDSNPRAVAEYMNKKGLESVYLIGPNYAAGKENLGGVKAVFKGKIVGEDYTKWPGQLDFSAELSKIRAANPKAVYAFYPGASGVQFLNQYAQAGLQGKIPLYTTFVIDAITLALQKDAAVGVISVLQWGADLPNETNKKYVSDFKARHKREPTFYGAQTYDAMNLIASAVAAVKGNLDNQDAVRAALEKADFKSVRGDFKFGPNHYPIQNYYKQEVVKEGGNYRLKTIETAAENYQDVHYTKCKM